VRSLLKQISEGVYRASSSCPRKMRSAGSRATARAYKPFRIAMAARSANAASSILRRLAEAACFVVLASHPAAALDAVSLQLKWKHQFQFTGYYAALEQGFYREAGLDVSIRDGGPGIEVAETVASGKADFGVCSASVLREWTMGRRLVVLAAIFQHSRPSFCLRAGLTSAACRICEAAH
jgi:ABC-type nitrate/sulfonate/bicarbonate transport system substrate-binding protein